MSKKIFYPVILFFLTLLIIVVFSINYNVVFVDELIYCRWIYKMVTENLSLFLPIQWGKHPTFFWFNRFLVSILKDIPFIKLSILNVLKGTALINSLLTVFGLSLFFKEKKLKIFIPLIFLLGPFFLIYFSIGTVENIIIPLVIIYWYSLGKSIENINIKSNWLRYYFLANVFGLLVALTKSNSSSVILSSLIYFLIFIKIKKVRLDLKWVGLIILHILFLILNLLIAFYFSKAESSNVMSFTASFFDLFTSIYKYFSYIPYFFSFTFIYLIIISFFKISFKSVINYINNPINRILLINWLIGLAVVSLLKVYYPRYFLIAILPLFIFLAGFLEISWKYLIKEKGLITGLVIFLLVDILFVFFPSGIYKWRIPKIDIIQHFERSSVHIPYDFKKNVFEKNPKATFLINDDRYGANNLFFALIPVSINYPNFKIIVYEDINKLEPNNLCKQYPKQLIYIWGDSSLTNNKIVLGKFLLNSYFSFNKDEYISIYKILCK